MHYQIRALDMKTMLFYVPCQLLYRILGTEFDLLAPIYHPYVHMAYAVWFLIQGDFQRLLCFKLLVFDSEKGHLFADSVKIHFSWMKLLYFN